MIQSFRDKRTLQFAEGKRVKLFEGFTRQAQRRLRILNDSESLEDLMALPSNRFEALSGNRLGQYSIRINNQWRICFTFEEGDFHNVEITDYH